MPTSSAPLLSTQQAAQWLGIKAQTLSLWRTQRRGPAFVKLGRAVRYRLDDLQAFLSSSSDRPALPSDRPGLPSDRPGLPSGGPALPSERPAVPSERLAVPLEHSERPAVPLEHSERPVLAPQTQEASMGPLSWPMAGFFTQQGPPGATMRYRVLNFTLRELTSDAQQRLLMTTPDGIVWRLVQSAQDIKLMLGITEP
jgi:predicted DNA-binding transcriptional regulator AlpA